MEDLFSAVAQAVAQGRNRILAVHNAVVDDVFALPLTRADFRSRFDSGEQRFQGPESERIGGGAINFALTSSSLGHPGAAFAGFMDRCAACMVGRLKRAGGLSLPVHYETTKARRNTVIELLDDNLLLHDSSASNADPARLASLIRAAGIGEGGWLASCSFYLEVTVPLLELSRRFFLDSGYGYPRREKGMMGSLLGQMKGRSFDDFIVAANQTEFDNLCDEFGIEGSTMPRGRALAEELSARSGSQVRVLLHTASFSTLFGPQDGPAWAVPTMDIPLRRRTNAGDTFAGAFLSAFDATGDARLSAFFANASAAKRLADDELPSRQNVSEFLRRARLRSIRLEGAGVLGPDELRGLRPRQESSVCLIASPAGGRPALQIAK